ncbi:hypothetical protein EGJ27_21705 [Pseudomonas sp. v388]|uniref:hypothetical protein n=1 Tax=Pseudomonas sp. v388 TaxID=2479849 RepID=UPI000F7A3AE4|nr:hypothetical protein [Pseudomonas sp. v388]RRV04453.1 hypothetical protein EGJ27_21705 [Pseudomonas sp. v388]
MGWKDHPVIVAALTAAATLAFSTTVILPIWTKVQDNRIEEYQLSEKGLKERVEVAESLAAELSRLNKIMTAEGTFRINDRYPKGLRDLKLGDTVDSLKRKYPNAKDEDENYWFNINIKDNSVFKGVSYHYSDKTQKITGILYFFKDPDVPAKGGASHQQSAMLEQVKYAFPDAEVVEVKRGKELIYELYQNKTILLRINLAGVSLL